MGRSVGGIDLNSCFSQLFIRQNRPVLPPSFRLHDHDEDDDEDDEWRSRQSRGNLLQFLIPMRILGLNL